MRRAVSDAESNNLGLWGSLRSGVTTLKRLRLGHIGGNGQSGVFYQGGKKWSLRARTT